jgi:hypothetical protein
VSEELESQKVLRRKMMACEYLVSSGILFAGRRCTKCGRVVGDTTRAVEKQERCWVIRQERVGFGGKTEPEVVGGAGDSGGKRDEMQVRGGAEQGGKVGGPEHSVDPHVKPTSSDESCILLCGQCLQVSRPAILPPTYQPERLTVGVEDRSLLSYLPALLERLDKHGGAAHLELEHGQGGYVVAHYTPADGIAKSFTLGRSSSAVEVPARRHSKAPDKRDAAMKTHGGSKEADHGPEQTG